MSKTDREIDIPNEQGTGTGTESSILYSPNKFQNHRKYRDIRDRLIQAIETTIGRPIEHRNSTKTIDPRKSDAEPPNLYQWQFSEEYKEFPDTKGGISRWSAEQLRCCNIALDLGHLRVVNVCANDTEAMRRVGGNTSATATVRIGSANQLDPIRQPDITLSQQNFKEEVDRAQNRSLNLGSFTMDITRMFEEKLDNELKKQAEELKQQYERTHASELSKLRSLLEETQKELRAEKDARNADASRISDLQKQLDGTKRENAISEDAIAARIANARKEGEFAGRIKAIDDLETNLDAECRALRRSHLEQIDRVRDDEFLKGFEEGKKLSSGSSIIPRTSTQDLAENSQEIKEKHHAELRSATELGRREGRALAYKELALGPEETVNSLIQNHIELNTNRKVRELKTIHQNWNDIPQRVLPSGMLPAGHTPGDKTLYLLAKLSKEVDGARAAELLKNAIDRRNQNLHQDARSGIVTNADVRNVLEILHPSDSRRSAPSLEPSATPQPTSQGQRSSYPTVTTTSESEERRDPSMKEPRENIGSADNSRASRNTRQENDQRIEEVLRALPLPSSHQVPSFLQTFPLDFLQKRVGCVDSAFAKGSSEVVLATPGKAMLGKQVVSWPEIIRINPEHHPDAPTAGNHGALTFVKGSLTWGEIGKIYPAILRNDKNRFSYIGHYKLVSRENLVPVHAFKDLAVGRRHKIASDICVSKWGGPILKKIGWGGDEFRAGAKTPLKTGNPKLDDGNLVNAQIDRILDFFEGEDEPKIRMTWTVLQFIEFRHDQYSTLVLAQKGSIEGTPAPIPQTLYDEALQRWLDPAFRGEGESRWDKSMEVIAAGLLMPASELHKLSKYVLRYSQNAGMTGSAHLRMSLASLKRYWAAMALELWATYPLGRLRGVDNVVSAFETVQFLFHRENNALASSGETVETVGQAIENLNSPPPSPAEVLDAALKRRRPEGQESVSTTRPKRLKVGTRISYPQGPMGPDPVAEARTESRTTVEVTGSPIFVDSTEAAPNVKNDPVGNNAAEEDLYEATPPPTRWLRGKRR